MSNAQHRILNTVAWVVIMIAGIMYGLQTEDRLDVCSDILYEHLTKTPAPQGVWSER